MKCFLQCIYRQPLIEPAVNNGIEQIYKTNYFHTVELIYVQTDNR